MDSITINVVNVFLNVIPADISLVRAHSGSFKFIQKHSDAFQNGIYRQHEETKTESDFSEGRALNGGRLKTATMVLYMTEVDEVVYTQTPEYGLDLLLSDVGGTAGLILGMSFATVIGLIDIILQHIAKVGILLHTEYLKMNLNG